MRWTNVCHALVVFWVGSSVAGAAGSKRSRDYPVDIHRVPRMLPFPASDEEATSFFMSDEWQNIDQFGQPRVTPSHARWNTLTELVPVWLFPTDEINISPVRLGKSTFSVVYPIARSRNMWAIKYHAYCADSFPVDPMLREAYFLELISRLAPGEIANRFLYFSAGREVANVGESSPKMILTDGACPGSSKAPVVRFIISERTGETLWNYMTPSGVANAKPTALPFREAVSLGISTIRLVQKLHALNIVHGDIHLANIAFTRRNVFSSQQHRSDLVLIDFERARIAESASTAPEAVPEHFLPMFFCHGYFSVWEAVGAKHPITHEIWERKPAFRDDVYRALFTMSMLIHGISAKQIPEALCSNANKDELRKAFQYRAYENWFDVPDIQVPDGTIYSLSLRDKLPSDLVPFYAHIRNTFAQVLAHVRNIRFRGQPDYMYLIELLGEVINPTATESATII